MSLLKLSPDSERLRRFARAHAAGEMSTPEYRQARAQVIANFDTDAANDMGDDTQRRWRPKQAPAADEPAPVAPSASAAAVVNPPNRWRAVVAFAILLAMVVFGMGQAWAATIPAVKDRDPNPATSERMAVTRIVMTDFAASAAAGVSREALDEFMAAQLERVASADAALVHGFNARELDEVAHLLNALGAGERKLSAADAAEIGELVARQRSSRGVSVVQLESIAAQLTAFYRERGYPLAVAYVPAQTVTAGEVQFDVQLGVLESVAVVGDSRYDEALLARAFESQRGAPVQRAPIESALYRVNQLPGLQTRATFRPGTAIGATQLQLTAMDEAPLSGSVRLDNHGDDATGNERLVLRGNWFNPSGRGDVITAEFVGAANPSNTVYGALGYEIPFSDLTTRALARVSVDDFDWQMDATRLDGRAFTAAAGLRRELSQSRNHSDGVDALLTTSKLELDQSGVGSLVDQDFVMAGFGYDTTDRFDVPKLSTTLRGQVDVGRINDGELAGQSDTFYRFSTVASAWRLIDLPGFDAQQRVSASLTGQWASTALPGTLQMSLAGAGQVAGFDASVASADTGAVANLTLRLRDWDVRYGDLLLFVDAGYGEAERAFDDEAWAYLASAGAGWQIDMGPHFSAQLKGSVPMAARGAPDLTDQGFNLFWMVRYVP